MDWFAYSSSSRWKGMEMAMLHIHDEDLARRLLSIAEQENRPVEAVLEALLATYETTSVDPQATVSQVRRKAYAKARRYWQEVGDTTKAALTDDELGEQFGRFDMEGIPRLKSELKSSEPPVGSLAYAAKIANQSHLQSGRPDLARRSDEILDAALAEDLLKRTRGEDAAE
jgi:hypothetical protein